MSISTTEIVEILDQRGVFKNQEPQLPGIGEVTEEEIIYETPLDDIFGDGELYDIFGDGELSTYAGTQLEGLLGDIENCTEETWKNRKSIIKQPAENEETLRLACAWYCPIHYYGHGWGIYIRQNCIVSQMQSISPHIPWHKVSLNKWEKLKQLYLSSFYVFFLHEQFHHKVESFGLRLLISKNSKVYQGYKKNVYRKTYLSDDCLEEALANADSYKRLSEGRYMRKIDPEIRSGLREFLRLDIPLQSAGYRKGVEYIDKNAFADGLKKLQSQILEKSLKFKMNPNDWSVAPKMTTALKSIDTRIYTILPKGHSPILPSKHFDPRATASSNNLRDALIKHYGYSLIAGGKGSHVKLKRENFPTIILPGNQQTVSPGIIKQVLNIFGEHPISKLPELLKGNLK